MMPALIDRTGQTFVYILILKELGHDRIIGRCLLCGTEKEYRKADVVFGKSTNCGKHGYRNVDCVGKSYGNILVTKDLGHGRVQGKCLLCGNEKIFDRFAVVHGKVKSCGCQSRRGNKLIDYTGQTFNNILVLKELGHGKIWGSCFLCGKEKEFHKYAVIRGQAKSCGCDKSWSPRRFWHDE